MKISQGRHSPYHKLLKSGTEDEIRRFQSERMFISRRNQSADDLIAEFDRILAHHDMEVVVHISDLARDDIYIEVVKGTND